MKTLFENMGATFSDCRTWRYVLWRTWNETRGIVAFIGLNPSTADEIADDPTIRRCCDFAKRWGFGGIYMLNLFAFRSPDPKMMKSAEDPVGPDNDRALVVWAFKAEKVVFCWGNHGTYRGRGKKIMAKIGPAECFGFTKLGEPKHPLYLRADSMTVPVTF